MPGHFTIHHSPFTLLKVNTLPKCWGANYPCSKVPGRTQAGGYPDQRQDFLPGLLLARTRGPNYPDRKLTREYLQGVAQHNPLIHILKVASSCRRIHPRKRLSGSTF
jgi:hypothetical protein